MNNTFYHIVRAIVWPLVWLIFPIRVMGRENVGSEPVVLCGNHSHWIDPVLIVYALPRKFPLRIMAKKQIFEKPLIAKAMRKVGAFPVDRGNSDITAVKTAIRALKDGENLLIFPEGTRVDRPEEAAHKGGAAMIAIRSGVKMQPVFVGMEKKPFHRTDVIFGETYQPQYESRKGTAEEYQNNADEIMHRVYELGGVK